MPSESEISEEKQSATPSLQWDTSAPGFTFWKTRIAAALGLWRKYASGVALDHLQKCQKAQPELYAGMIKVPENELESANATFTAVAKDIEAGLTVLATPSGASK